MSDEDVLTLSPPPADARVRYGTGPLQFGDLRLPKSTASSALVINIHGGFWRNKYDLGHAGHLCAALTSKGLATWNIEYRRVGDEGGGWPGTLNDIRHAYRFIPQLAKQFHLSCKKTILIGHSAGGQLALCLAAHEPDVSAVISLAGVVDLHRAWLLHLSSDAVADFLGGPPALAAQNYAEADPMRLSIAHTVQCLIHGKDDDTVPPDFSRTYWETKKKRGEDVHLLEIEGAGHSALIDPRSAAWSLVESQILKLAI
jgi:acetyl esterase/lipase